MYERIFEEIARRNNSTVEKIYTEMQKAIECSDYYNENAAVETFLTDVISCILSDN